MRELKFRVWNKEEKLFWKSDDGIYFYLNDDLDRKLAVSVAKFIQKSDEFEIQQYTGLKDKNNKEIYEGDIVISNQESGTFEIKWNKESAAFMVGDDLWPNAELTIIGNVYQNQELLKN